MSCQLKRAMHFDFHTMPGIYDFNDGWDASVFAERLADARVGYVNIFAKCNLGFAYFPTKIGVPYPGMKGDMFGDALRECHKRGIGVTAYFNLGLDHEMANRNRGWCKLDANGQVLRGDRTGNFFRVMCLRTGYGDYMKALIGELIERYPEVDGIFLDCITPSIPCHGSECLEAVKAEGGNQLSPDAMADFTFRDTVRYCAELKEIIGERRLICNGLPYKTSKKLNSHIEIECLPSGWSYDYFGASAAYARTLKNEILYMTGRFQKNWGDFGGLKSKASLEYDVWDALSNGIGVSVGDHMHPARNVDPEILRTVGGIYRDVEAMEEWTDGARYLADICILISDRARSAATPAYNGAARMLSELHYTFDIADTDAPLDKYRLLIVPDDMRLDAAGIKKVAEFKASGKPVLYTGEGGLTSDGRDFAFADEGFVFDGLDVSTSPYYAEHDSADETLERSAYRGGVLMRAPEDAERLADYVKAYFDRAWDGFHGYFYTPPERADGHSAAAIHGKIGRICFKVFTSYYHEAYIEHKALVRRCLDRLFAPSFVCSGIPSTARVTVTGNEKYRLLHVKVTRPEPRGKMNIIEEHDVLPAGAEVALEGRFSTAYTVPGRVQLQIRAEDGHTVVTLPQITGYICAALI